MHFQGMDIYSTALWQLQDHHQLSALATELIASHRDNPTTWSVVGNSLSLQKHNEAAIEAFERAIQLDHRFAYAYSLLGHELVGLGHLSKAMDAFRLATIHAPNDYRALYGQGQVYYKSDQFANAKVVLKKALMINPRNTVLLCQLAVVEAALKNYAEVGIQIISYLNGFFFFRQPNT
jgi:anaphase-promoting complex subunit 3